MERVRVDADGVHQRGGFRKGPRRQLHHQRVPALGERGESRSFARSLLCARARAPPLASFEPNPSLAQVLDNALQGQETANFEFPLITKSGARIEVLLNASPRSDEGKVIGVVGIGCAPFV
jgi:PAS domain-containing protein